MGSKAVQLKVFVDNKKKKVIFAEANQDFVEILLSFFTLPLGTIARLTSKHDQDSMDTKVGSLNSLYDSIQNLDNKHFYNEHCKMALINPSCSSLPLCQKLKINLNDPKPVDARVSDHSHGDMAFFKRNGSFIITDDLNVVPVMLDASIALFKSLGVEYIDLLEHMIIDFGFEEFTSLLRWSLLTNNPLTNLVLGESKPCSCCIKNSTLSNMPLISSYSAQSRKVKLLVQKSKKKVLCAQVEKFFVEMLFSFLTIPFGNAKRLTTDYASSSAINNLYNSISSLGDGNYLKSEEIKTMLLRPKLATYYLRVTDLLPIYDKNVNAGSFLKEQATFIVSDDLEVTVSPSISTILKLNTLGVSNSDIEVMEVSIGEQEALVILNASLTSTSALTVCLDAFRKA